MPNKIKPRRSYTANSVPLTSDLDTHELAINWVDGKAFTKDASGNIVSVTLGGSGGGGGSGGSLSGSVTIPASDPYWDSVLLLLRGDGNFTDASKYGRTLTAHGNAAATAAGKYGTNSIALDGTGDYLSLSSSDFAWGTSDYTLEAWVWLNNLGSYGSWFSTLFSDGNMSGGVSAGITNTGMPYLEHLNGFSVVGSTAFPTAQWVHVAATRSGNTVKYYVNGSSVGSVSFSGSHTNSSVVVGRFYTDLDNNYWNGRIAELRVTKAARFTANFTPPTAALPTTIFQASPQTLPVTITGSGGGGSGSLSGSVTIPASGDQYWANTALLLKGDDLTDSSSYARTVTAYGNAAATGTAKYGVNSLAFDGSGDYLRVAGSSAFALPGDFTLEAWVYFNAASASFDGAYGACLMATYPTGQGGNQGWQLRINGTSTAFNTINVYTGTTDLNWSATFNLNQWHHVAVTRSGSSIRAFVDGVQVGSTVNNSDDMSPGATTDLWIGQLNASPYLFSLNGRLDDLRVTKGTARWVANFTPPAAALGTGAYTAAQTLPVVFS
jgi:hypothetical protein